ncbi:hypothetical protein L1887_47935 [Cichorium endivia]|nr:hypothetical protein L1887_47935 [Cichorium endivia]
MSSMRRRGTSGATKVRVTVDESRPLLVLRHGNRATAEAFDSLVGIVTLALEDPGQSVRILQLLHLPPGRLLLLVDGVLKVAAQALDLLDLLVQVAAQAGEARDHVVLDLARLVRLGDRVPVEELAPGLETVGENVGRRALGRDGSVEGAVEVLGLGAAAHTPAADALDAARCQALAAAAALEAAGATHAHFLLESVVPRRCALVGLAMSDSSGGSGGGAVHARALVTVDDGGDGTIGRVPLRKVVDAAVRIAVAIAQVGVIGRRDLAVGLRHGVASPTHGVERAECARACRSTAVAAGCRACLCRGGRRDKGVSAVYVAGHLYRRARLGARRGEDAGAGGKVAWTGCGGGRAKRLSGPGRVRSAGDEAPSAPRARMMDCTAASAPKRLTQAAVRSQHSVHRGPGAAVASAPPAARSDSFEPSRRAMSSRLLDRIALRIMSNRVITIALIAAERISCVLHITTSALLRPRHIDLDGTARWT